MIIYYILNCSKSTLSYTPKNNTLIYLTVIFLCHDICDLYTQKAGERTVTNVKYNHLSISILITSFSPFKVIITFL